MFSSSISLVNYSNGLNTGHVNHPSTNEVTDRVNQMAPHAIEVISQNLNTLPEKKEDYFHFQFPEGSTITTYSPGQTINLSGISVDLHHINGGIGYGGSASKLMADAMDALGHGETVYNLPFCIEGLIIPFEYTGIKMISSEDLEVKDSTVKDIIEETIRDGFTHINIPIKLNGHASLATLIISDKSASLRFYDSMSPDKISYDKRYGTILIEFISSHLPEFIKLNESHEVLHILDQGGAESAGCGYYTVYTALLLKDDAYMRNLDSKSFNGCLLFDQSFDNRIRAELVVRTMLAHGLENVNADPKVLMCQKREHIYDKIDRAVVPLKEKLLSRLSSL